MAGNEERRVRRFPKRGESFFGGEYVEGESSATATARNKALRERGEGIIWQSSAAVEEEEEEEEDPPVLLFSKTLDAYDMERLVFGSADFEEVKWLLNDEEKAKASSADDFLGIVAEDQWGSLYVLHLGLWSVENNTYSLSNQWGVLVAVNALKIGDTVEIWGHVVGADNVLRLKVLIPAQNAAAEGVKIDRNWEPRIRKGITIPEAIQPPVFLFKKVLDGFDMSMTLNRLGVDDIVCLSWVLTDLEMLLVEEDYLGVLTEGPRGHKYKLRLRKEHGEYSVEYEWAKLVADSRLKVGDTIEGWGYRVGTAEFRLKIVLFRIPFPVVPPGFK